MKKALATAEKRLTETQDLLATREREHQAAVRQTAAEHGRVADCRSQLETALEAANEEARSLRANINSAEKRKSALEARLASCELEKREAEMRLNSIHSSLRRIIGFRQEAIIAGSRSRSPGHRSSSRGRSASPIRLAPAGESAPAAAVQASPFHAGVGTSADLDPEAVRLGLRDVALRLASAEHARDDANARVHSLEARLQEQAEQTEQWARRLHMVQQALCEVEEDKKGVDGRLASAQKALMLQEETLRKNERDRKLLAEKISQLERNFAGAESEKRQEQAQSENLNSFQDMVTKLKQSEARQEEEKIQLRHALEDAENRINQLEVLRQSLEAEVQRCKCVTASKEAESAHIKEKNNALTKKRQDLEAKCSSLQLKIDQLSLAQSRTEEDSKGFKLKIDQLNMTILENNHALEEVNERLRKTQKALTACEKEKLLLQASSLL
ncbi:unnamed protein product [Schistocephalus solidus]|uniref:Uncharacterized protein n=1 Tax=Schistocephalus solidus TaxID=70667 RepID=A0A3P7D2S2_SCHSO|nr:unnamed protein product [Schistocephalus solidus]